MGKGKRGEKEMNICIDFGVAVFIALFFIYGVIIFTHFCLSEIERNLKKRRKRNE